MPKKCVITHNIADWLQTDYEREFKNNIFEEFCESKGIAKIYEVLYNSQHQEAVEVFIITIQSLSTSPKDNKNEKYNLERSYNTFLMYYNDREHSTTKVAPFRAVMNFKNKDLIC